MLGGSKGKSLKVEFPHPQIRGLREERMLIEFETKEMWVDDTLVFRHPAVTLVTCLSFVQPCLFRRSDPSR